MLRRALPSLFCAFALAASAYGQEIFVPRELKAIPVHPQKTKEAVKRPEPAVEPAVKAPAKETVASTETAKPKAPKVEIAPAKTEKAVAKEKSVPAKADETTSKKVAEVSKEKEKAPKEKPAKSQAPADDVATIKVEKTVASKETKSSAKAEKEKSAPAKEKADDLPMIKIEKATTSAKEPVKAVAKTDAARTESKPEKAAPKSDAVKVETVTAKNEKTEKGSEKDKPATVAASKTLRPEKAVAKEEPKKLSEPAKPEVAVAKNEKPAAPKEKEKPAKIQPAKSEPLIAKLEPAPPRDGPTKVLPSKPEQVSIPTQLDVPQAIPAVSGTLDTGFARIADGFDFPVGRPEAEGYYKARGFRPGGHVGEDWDGVRGGDTDFKDPIFSIGDGIVVFARDVHLGWGNVIIVRHAYRENGNVKYVDALYGHLNAMLVSRGQRVNRGQQIATMGTAHGQYDAHLHFEIRKNLEIGMSRSKFQKDFSNYYDPTQFINGHRRLSGGGANYKVAMNTFTHDWMYHFDKNRNFSARKRSTSESSAALRRTLTSSR
jgi:murein DD-endopeptidase MepM/ murein hydrolase activator NlpD